MLSNKNIIITGCARGIGKSMLDTFSKNKANVFACARKQTNEFDYLCKQLSDENNVNIYPIYFDFSNTDEIKESVKKILSYKLPLHGLVNNAGVIYNSLFQMTSVDKMKEIFNINFFSQVLFTQYLIKNMVRQKFGSIVNISSTAAIDGNSGKSAYGASKGAFISLTKTMATEFGQYNIRVNSIAPGITDTDMVSGSISEEIINKTIQQTKLKRIGNVVDIANTAMYLVSDKSVYITGQVIRVDGGLGI